MGMLRGRFCRVGLATSSRALAVLMHLAFLLIVFRILNVRVPMRTQIDGKGGDIVDEGCDQNDESGGRE